MMRRSWIVEKQSDGYQFWFHAVPVQGDGKREEAFSRSFVRHRTPYFVSYEGDRVPESLCECGAFRNIRGLIRLAHVYSWADAPWIELVAWG